MLMLAGCVSPPEITPHGPATGGAKNCTTVITQVPFTTKECNNVSYTEQVCGTRELPFTAVQLTKIDLCTADGPCVGKSLGECGSCSKAMSRCTMVIENKDPQKSGTWTVAVNFTYKNYGFNKEPVSKEIAPNGSYAFDVYQIYDPGTPLNSADCTMVITAKPSVQDCHDETRVRTDCQNVTAYSNETKNVCQ
jgi:hypothetical protein